MPLKRMRSLRALAGLLLATMPAGAQAYDASDVVYFEDAPDGQHFRAAFPAGPPLRFINAVLHGAVSEALHEAASLPDGVNTVGKYGHTALEIAAWRGDRAMVAALLAAGARPNGGANRAPIGVAFAPGREPAKSIELARLLVKSGADPDGLSYDNTAMQNVAEEGNIPAIVALAEMHADMNRPHGSISPALFSAAEPGHWMALETMLHHGGSIWVIDTLGFTLGAVAQDYQTERLNALLSPEEAAARDRVIALLKEGGFPWPPPSLEDALKAYKSGHWPPKHR